MGALLEKRRTPYAFGELRAALREALGGNVARSALAAWCVPPSIETAWGAACWHHNVGNITTRTYGSDGWRGDWYRIAAPEYIKGKWVEMKLAYRAFSSLTEGVRAWVGFMRTNYPRAASALDAGRSACVPASPCDLKNPHCASCAMKARGYYTAPLERYLKNARWAQPELERKLMVPERTYTVDIYGDADALRAYVVEQARRLVPCDLGDAVMAELCQGRGGWARYSSCGDLGHYLLDAVGCRDGRLVNRDDPFTGRKWAVSQNMSKLLQGGRELRCWVDARGAARPPPGVIAMVGDRSKGEQEHVLVPLLWTGDTLLSADLGQANDAGKQCGRFVERTFRVEGGRPLLGSRHLLGWVDPALAPRNAEALELWDRPAADLGRGAKALNASARG
jgi:hypothetical protein